MNLKSMFMKGKVATVSPTPPPSPDPLPEEARSPTAHDIFVARQPIFDRQLDVMGYELLFRRGEVNAAGPLEPEQASAQVLVNTFLGIGINTLVGEKRAFVNFSRDFLLDGYVREFPAERVGIEVLESATVDADLIEVVRSLSARGYTLALDDFILHESLLPLVELADIIKLDVLALDQVALEEHVALLRPYEVKLVAEKVETRAAFTFCQNLGFDYFQGYFFCVPEIVKGRRMATNRLALLHLLAQLQDPDVAFDDLEALISQDATLSYKLLRVVNSAFYARPMKIETIRQASLLLGLKSITTWASLLLLASVDDKPPELIKTAAVRAKMCEVLAEAGGTDEKASLFLVGLFSVLDAIMDCSMQDVLQTLPLADPINRALLDNEGPWGTTLRCVLDYEHGQWDANNALKLDQRQAADAYLKAITWANETISIIAA
jgi:EAL and modified HD-GYP domain-containing signal transduction protein